MVPFFFFYVFRADGYKLADIYKINKRCHAQLHHRFRWNDSISYCFLCLFVLFIRARPKFGWLPWYLFLDTLLQVSENPRLYCKKGPVPRGVVQLLQKLMPSPLYRRNCITLHIRGRPLIIWEAWYGFWRTFFFWRPSERIFFSVLHHTPRTLMVDPIFNFDMSFDSTGVRYKTNRYQVRINRLMYWCCTFY